MRIYSIKMGGSYCFIAHTLAPKSSCAGILPLLDPPPLERLYNGTRNCCTFGNSKPSLINSNSTVLRHAVPSCIKASGAPLSHDVSSIGGLEGTLAAWKGPWRSSWKLGTGKMCLTKPELESCTVVSHGGSHTRGYTTRCRASYEAQTGQGNGQNPKERKEGGPAAWQPDADAPSLSSVFGVGVPKLVMGPDGLLASSGQSTRGSQPSLTGSQPSSLQQSPRSARPLGPHASSSRGKPQSPSSPSASRTSPGSPLPSPRPNLSRTRATATDAKSELRKSRMVSSIDSFRAPQPGQERKGDPKYSKAARRYFNNNFRVAERLSKVLAAAGVASRRGSEDIIFAGRVTVNGEVCTVPQTAVDPLKDSIYVDGSSLPRRAPPKLYFILNKPKGYICSNATDGPRPVLELLDSYFTTWMARNPGLPKPRLFTVGRLDVATTGLLLVTNDGDFAQQVGHPSSGITKEYVVTVEERPSRRHLAAMAAGTVVDGVRCVPVEVGAVEEEPGEKHHRIRVVVSEGRNREVRHIVETAGLSVHSLKRVRIGGLRMSRKLAVGKYQALTEVEIKKMLNLN